MPELAPVPARSPTPPEDIAAAMGFSSFGAKPNHPKKKRKLADPNSEGSGSNNTPLGVRTRELDGQQVGEDKGRGRCQLRGLGRVQGQGQRQEQWSRHSEPQEQSTASNAPADPDPLTAAALDESAAMLLETGHLPQYLDWSGGSAADGPHDSMRWLEQGPVGGQAGGGAWEEMRRQGKRGDGEWDWQALRRGVVVDERGDVAFYDGSFVEDPWSGLRGGRGEGM